MYKFKNKILLVRHGQSILNHDSKFTGWTNIPLTTIGKKEAQNISKKLIEKSLKPNIIFSSVLDRCIQTSNIIKKNLHSDIPIHTTWRLNEKHYGTLEGIPREIIRKEYGDKFTDVLRSNYYMKPPILENVIKNKYNIYKNCYFNSIKNGESKEDVLNRLLPYFKNDIMYTLSENKFPLIVTHKHTARVLMKHLLNLNESNFEEYNLPSKSLILLNFNDNYEFINYEKIKYD